MGNSINSFIYLKENNINETKPLVYPVINDNSIKHIFVFFSFYFKNS